MSSKASQCLGPIQTKVLIIIVLIIPDFHLTKIYRVKYILCVIPLQEKQVCLLIMFTVNYSTPPSTDNILEHVRAEKRGSEKADSYDETPGREKQRWAETSPQSHSEDLHSYSC